MSESTPVVSGFNELGLSEPVLKALSAIGYEVPSQIQAAMIPHVLSGRDVVGQAQTGTGKTAAFALPLLSKLDVSEGDPQVLVLVPTRELAIQVAEAFQKYAAHIPGFHVLPIYGGSAYGAQLRQLQRGTHVIVGTPGRLCDHLRRGTLTLASLKTLVLDEADEMLRMGFIDEVEWILEQTPKSRQVALFSATMPEAIRRIARQHLSEAVEITIKASTTTAATIRQRFWLVSGLHKLDALTRILEGETYDGMIIFVRTKTAAVDLAERLSARGIAAAPLNGDIPQNLREQTIDKLRSGDLDIVVATDVAARGLDVQRISHVVNYDIPTDIESYVHRIGRTGRAGRQGEAILFVAPRERRLLHAIESATKQKIELMKLPTTDEINDIRVTRFKDRIKETLAVEDLGFYYQLVEQFRQENNIPAIEIAAALAKIVQGDVPLLLEGAPEAAAAPAPAHHAPAAPARAFDDGKPKRSWENRPAQSAEKTSYRVEVGAVHGLKPGQLVGAIANEAGIEGRRIGRIDIKPDFTIVEIGGELTNEAISALQGARVCGRPLRLRPDNGPPGGFRKGGPGKRFESAPPRKLRFNKDKRRPPHRG
jgi:ATP-dependent RNA helicase DeaD